MAVKKFKIKNEFVKGFLADLIEKGIADEDVMDSAQRSIGYQWEDEHEFVAIFLGSKIYEATGIPAIHVKKSDIEKVEPVDLNGWIPVGRADEIDDDIGEGLTVLIAKSIEAVEFSETHNMWLGEFANGEVNSFDFSIVPEDYVFKFVTL